VISDDLGKENKGRGKKVGRMNERKKRTRNMERER